MNTRAVPHEAARPADLTDLIERYEQGHQLVLDAIGDAKGAELDVREAPGEWSPRQVAHHLADSETISVMRFRRLLVEDRPCIASYAEPEYADRLFYDRPIEDSLNLFRYARETAALILRRLEPAAWKRAGIHSSDGEFTVLDWLKSYVRHAEEHADQIRRARLTPA